MLSDHGTAAALPALPHLPPAVGPISADVDADAAEVRRDWRVGVFIGTRPEAIKMAPVIRELESAPDFQPVVISTGQHGEMLQQVTDLFRIAVDHDLQAMRPGQSLAALSGRLLLGIDEILERDPLDFALVQGDTTTVLMASVACFYRRVPLGHVEAGLRTGRLDAPFPEEAHRRLVAPLAALHFCPTQLSCDHLLREGIAPERIVRTGNTVVDALQLEVRRQRQPEVQADIDRKLAALLGDDDHALPYVLVTCHRRENLGDGVAQICAAIGELASRFPNHRFVFAVHLNPQVRGPVHQSLAHVPNVRLIPPQPYSEFVALMQRCRLILSDSGGVQEEAPSLGKPVLIMRDATERPEGRDAGVAKLVGAAAERIVAETTTLLTDPQAYAQMATARNPYGDGRAAQCIVRALRAYVRTSA